jgi:hypothetical protein
MNLVGDVFTVGIVLLLLIGAVAFYLYTRIAQVEKHMNLLESILLDLKVATENSFLGFPMPMMGGGGKSGGASGSNSPKSHHEDDEDELLSEYVPKMPTAHLVSEEDEELSTEDLENDTDMYEKILESVNAAANGPVEGTLEEVDLETADDAEETRSVSIPAPLPEPMKVGETSEEVHVNKVEPNYESLSVKELKELAKARGISGAAKLGRRDIIDSLRKKDSGAEDGISSSLADYGFGSSLDGAAASIDA